MDGVGDLSTFGLLMSGGIDSTCIAVWKRPSLLIHIDYGQRPAMGERKAAHQIASLLDLPLRTMDVDCSILASGDMAKGERRQSVHGPNSDWWPFRNQLLLTLVAPVALEASLEGIAIGCLKTDAHLDASSTFIEAMDRVLSSQEGNLRVVAPAARMSALELVRASAVPSELLGATMSCHRANMACGDCRGCYKRQNLFHELKLEA